MDIEIIAADSLGVRSLCCSVRLADRHILLDPGVALDRGRQGLLPHPVQIKETEKVRGRIIELFKQATDLVFSHYHGDHIPLLNADPYQLSLQELPEGAEHLSCWAKSSLGDGRVAKTRSKDLAHFFGHSLNIADGMSEGVMTFSLPMPHGEMNSPRGTVMMTRIEAEGKVFVHASDIQLLNEVAIEQILSWQPDIVLTAGPPLYLGKLNKDQLRLARENAIRLVRHVDTVIIDHHLMRGMQCKAWLKAISEATGKQVYCAADFMRRPWALLEAQRKMYYETQPVPEHWHREYAAQV